VFHLLSLSLSLSLSLCVCSVSVWASGGPCLPEVDATGGGGPRAPQTARRQRHGRQRLRSRLPHLCLVLHNPHMSMSERVYERE
jgi:hypothetical protein